MVKAFDDLNPNERVSGILNWGFGSFFAKRTNSVLYEDVLKSKCFVNFENLIILEKGQQFTNLMEGWVL